MKEIALLFQLLPFVVLLIIVWYHRREEKKSVPRIVGSRARNNDGRFVADNPKTEDWNEAYIGGKKKRIKKG